MSIALREENFIVINVGSSITTAGIDMHDTNRPPSVFVNMADYNYPIKKNLIANWKDLEECWHHILFKELNIKKSRNESPVLLTVPVEWTKLEYERITQIFFENFNVPGIYIAPQPLLSLFGCGSVSGMVVDIGGEITDVNVIVDSNIELQSSITVSVGGNQFDEYLLKMMKADDKLVQQFSLIQDIELDLAFAKFVRELPGICNISIGYDINNNTSTLSNMMEELPTESTEELIDEDNPKKEEEEEMGDIPEIVEIEYKGHKLNIGPYRHKALDPLFLPELINADSLSLPEAIRLATMNCEPPEMRSKLLESIVVTGGCSLTAGLNKRLKAELQLYLPQSDNSGDTQPHQLNFLRIPDYFTVLKEKKYHHYSTWLGAEIVAKLVFIDAKNYISKVDYNESGPSVVHTKTY